MKDQEILMKKSTINTANRSLKRITKNTIGLANEYIKKNPSIKNRAYSMKLEGEFSSLKYEITASGSIISKMHKALEKILERYPRDWEDIKWGSKG